MEIEIVTVVTRIAVDTAGQATLMQIVLNKNGKLRKSCDTLEYAPVLWSSRME
jgi:hypothetical protein